MELMERRRNDWVIRRQSMVNRGGVDGRWQGRDHRPQNDDDIRYFALITREITVLKVRIADRCDTFITI